MKHLTKISLYIVVILALIFTSCNNNEVKNLSLDKSSIAIHVGQSDSVSVKITLSGDISEQPLTWTMSTANIVSVSESTVASTSTTGSVNKTIILTALKTGSTAITFQTGGKTTECTVNVDQRTYTFTQSITSNWGDYYDVGTNSFDMYLLENTLTVNDSGKLSGNGTVLFLDFSVALTQNTFNEGTFAVSTEGEVNTFFPGGAVESNGETYIFGTRLITFGQENKITLIKDGHYSATLQGSNFLIEGDLITETNEVIHFVYTGPVDVKDLREEPVEIYPAFTKGELIYFDDIYNSGTSNNYVAYLASDSVNFEDSVLNGEVLALEINTSRTATNSLPDGTYNMMPALLTSNLVPFSLVPGYTTSDGNNWGSWYYNQTTTKKLKTGNAVITKSGDTYTINYLLYDRFGSKVSGTFNGKLTYKDATNASGVKSSVGIKKPHTVRSFAETKVTGEKIKPFRFGR